MLTLGRKPGEYIVIDGKIVITVEYDEGLSRVSIDAPKDMEIMRGEVWEQEFPRPACLNKPVQNKIITFLTGAWTLSSHSRR